MEKVGNNYQLLIIIYSMNKLFPLLLTSIAGISAILGNVLLFVNPKHIKQLLPFSLGMSFSVMFLISIFELIPEGVGLLVWQVHYFILFLLSLMLLLFGYCIVLFIESRIASKNSIYKIGVLNTFSLFFHNIPEGILCAISTLTNMDLGFKMCYLIMLHNIPEGISISLPIYYSTGSKKKSFLLCLVSSFGEVFGALLSIIFLYKYINDYLLFFIYLITAGIMISLSLLKIFKEGWNTKNYFSFIFGIVIGILIFILTL